MTDMTLFINVPPFVSAFCVCVYRWESFSISIRMIVEQETEGPLINDMNVICREGGFSCELNFVLSR